MARVHNSIVIVLFISLIFTHRTPDTHTTHSAAAHIAPRINSSLSKPFCAAEIAPLFARLARLAS